MFKDYFALYFLWENQTETDLNQCKKKKKKKKNQLKNPTSSKFLNHVFIYSFHIFLFSFPGCYFMMTILI